MTKQNTNEDMRIPMNNLKKIIKENYKVNEKEERREKLLIFILTCLKIIFNPLNLIIIGLVIIIILLI